MIKKLFIAAGLLAIATAATAATKSSDISLRDITAKPHSYEYVPFDRLLPDVEYEIKCSIASDGVSQQKDNIVQFNIHGQADIWVKGERVYDGHAFKIPTKLPIPLEIFTAYKSDGGFNIHNLDDTDTINITNCVASPHVDE